MWVPEHVRSDIPGSIEAVHRLAGRGLTLHTASGGLSWELAPYLRGMGIRERFDRLYGPDLVDTTKNGPHYYAAILADSRTDPAAAAVVDDSADARAWASAVGLRPYSSLADLVAAFE
jgi:phosphoglycolate phosphatase-like HAD superfamily hydrolase